MLKKSLSLFTVWALLTHQSIAAEFLYVSGSDEILRRYSLSGGPLGQFSFHPFSPEFGIIHNAFAVNEAGFVYSTYGQTGTVKRHSPAGNDLGVFATVPDTALGLTFDKTGVLFAGVNSTPDTVERIAADGTNLGLFATSPNNGVGAPFELVFDVAGNLYQPAFHTVERFDPRGNALGTYVTLPGSNDVHILDLDFDSAGNLYAMTNLQTLYKFDTSGSLVGQILSVPRTARFDISKSDIIYVSSGNSVQLFKTDGSPLGTIVDDIPSFHIIRDLEIVEVIPEPATSFLAWCSFAAALLVTRRTRQA